MLGRKSESIDRDGSASIASRELKVAMRALGFMPKKGINPEKDFPTWTQLRIEYEQFLNMMTHTILHGDPTLKAFRLFDEDENGKVAEK